jgi:hypothetical protein
MHGPVRGRLVGVRTRALFLLGIIGLLVGCGSTGGGSTAGNRAAAQEPSDAAKMICATEAQTEVVQALGLTASRPATAAWAAPVYSCTYTFAAGVVVLSVRELAGAPQTTAYFNSVQNDAGTSTRVPDLGEAAIAVADGTVYVRKDFKVLKVDVSKLPAFVGQPPISRAAAAVRVAGVIMGCWTDN